MEKLGKICVLCCQHLPTSSISSSSKGKVFGEFRTLFKELTTHVSTSRHSSSSTCGQSQKKSGTGDDAHVVNVDLFCLSCQTLLFPAAELHEKTMETEARVSKLQRQILEELRHLQRQLLQFSAEMKRVQETIEREFPEDGSKADFRQKLFRVVRDLQLFNAELSPKIILPPRPTDESEMEECSKSSVSEKSRESEVACHGPIVKEELQFLNSQDSLDADDFGFDFDDPGPKYPDNYQTGFEGADPEPIDVKPKITGNFESFDVDVNVPKSGRGQKRKQPPGQGFDKDLDFHAQTQSDDNHSEEDVQSEESDGVETRKRGRKRRSRRLRSKVTTTTATVKKNVDTSENKKGKRKKTARARSKLLVAPGTEGMPHFKKSVISRIVSSQGVTFLSPPKRPILLQPFQQNPMKYDSETDVFSVANVPVIVHESEKSLECSSCSLKFQNGKNKAGVEFQVHEHILGHHLQTLRCHICDKVMTTFGGLQVHLRGHQEQVPCDICGRPFAEKRKMLRHKRTHQNASERAEASARGEGRGFENYLGVIKKQGNCSSEVISNLKEVIDKGEVPEWKRKLICRVIRENSKQNEDYEDKSPLAKYPMVYDPNTNKLSVSGIEIIMHEKIEVTLECSDCSKMFHGDGSKPGMRVETKAHDHILSQHFDAFRCPFAEDGCTALKKSFESHFHYNQHLWNFHANNEKQSSFVCETCGKISNSRTALSVHRMSHRNSTTKKPVSPQDRCKLKNKRNLPLKYQCSTCGNRFWRRSRLRSHELTHLTPEQKQYSICNRCGKRFSSVNGMNHHQKTVCFEEGRRPRFTCEFCSRSLKTSALLRKHIATIHSDKAGEGQGHSGESRPFQCSKCPKRFTTDWNRESHEKFKHPKDECEAVKEDPESCRCRRGCGKMMETAHGRKIHESYCDGTGCKTEKDRAKSNIKII